MKFTVTVVLLDHKLYSFYLQPYFVDVENIFLCDRFVPSGADYTQSNTHHHSYEDVVEYIDSLELHPLVVPEGFDATQSYLPLLKKQGTKYISFIPDHNMRPFYIHPESFLEGICWDHRFIYPCDILTNPA